MARGALPILSVGLLAILLSVPVMVIAPPTTPTFSVFSEPTGWSNRTAGEPSIGINWATHNALFTANARVLRVSFANATLPVTATWTDASIKTQPAPSVNGCCYEQAVNLDPILFTDHASDRTFWSGLLGACSYGGFTDNDGASWVRTPQCGLGAVADHQMIGAGPFVAGSLGSPVGYPSAVYYCAQAVAAAQCSVSRDGGITYGPAVPMYSLADCWGLHGHLRAAPNGTVYMPVKDCGDPTDPDYYLSTANQWQAVAVSHDNGLTWGLHPVTGTTTQAESDPGVAVGSGGKVYFCYQDGDGHPKAKTSTTGGSTWSAAVDLGAAFGIRNSQFPSVVAGDDDRAACAWLGTTTAGNDQASSFGGTWRVYVSYTYDGGATWQTANVFGPVQQGCIWMGGGDNPCRNLLDFMGIDYDSDGRVYVAFANGCAGGCAAKSAHATIARQDGGTAGLFAAKTLGN